MDGAALDRIVQHLWGAEADLVYAVLDGARDAAISDSVRSSDLPHCCLLAGELGPELAQVAPYLVRLQRSGELTRRLLRLGWGKSWGIFLATPSPLETVRRHLRRLLRVLGPDGAAMFFRYYDPRVLRTYLPTCNAGELGEVFGPVLRYAVEGEDGGELVVFRRAGPELARSVVDLRAAAPA
ncbi:DUF4123 domain-containing protein [Sorangium sp. So ce281]|uniref:DUF4123 domain-containing protein n=1 Tax=unclassified Sorangium TaxID=2621164 RepID=UPI003F5FE05E